jgi:hypothetical protein
MVLAWRPAVLLDDPAEEKDWRRYHGIMGGMAHLLNAALIMANDRLKELNSALHGMARLCLDCRFCFVASNSCSFHSR